MDSWLRFLLSQEDICHIILHPRFYAKLKIWTLCLCRYLLSEDEGEVDVFSVKRRDLISSLQSANRVRDPLS